MKKMLLNYEMSMKTSNAYVVPRMIVIDVDVKSLIAGNSDYGTDSDEVNEGVNDSDDLEIKTERWNDAW